MKVDEMRGRRDSACAFIYEAINELGPITDQTGGLIREPLVEMIGQLNDTMDELGRIYFDVYTKTGRPRRKPR